MTKPRSFPEATLIRLLTLSSYLINHGVMEIGKRIAVDACNMSTATLCQLRREIQQLTFHEDPLLHPRCTRQLLTSFDEKSCRGLELHKVDLLGELFNANRVNCYHWIAKENMLSTYLADALMEAIGELSVVLGWFDNNELVFGANVPRVPLPDGSLPSRVSAVTDFFAEQLPKIGLNIDMFDVRSILDFADTRDIPQHGNDLVILQLCDKLAQGQKTSEQVQAVEFLAHARECGVIDAINQMTVEMRKRERDLERDLAKTK